MASTKANEVESPMKGTQPLENYVSRARAGSEQSRNRVLQGLANIFPANVRMFANRGLERRIYDILNKDQALKETLPEAEYKHHLEALAKISRCAIENNQQSNEFSSEDINGFVRLAEALSGAKSRQASIDQQYINDYLRDIAQPAQARQVVEAKQNLMEGLCAFYGGNKGRLEDVEDKLYHYDHQLHVNFSNRIFTPFNELMQKGDILNKDLVFLTNPEACKEASETLLNVRIALKTKLPETREQLSKLYNNFNSDILPLRKKLATQEWILESLQQLGQSR